MFPVSDDNTRVRRLPVVTYSLILLNGLVFLLELSGGDQFIKEWAFIPAHFRLAGTDDIPIISRLLMSARGHLADEQKQRQLVCLVARNRHCSGVYGRLTGVRGEGDSIAGSLRANSSEPASAPL